MFFLKSANGRGWYHQCRGAASENTTLVTFLGPLKAGKAEADDRVERSLYSRGYSFNSEKIFCNKDGEVTRVPIVEHVPPDAVLELRLGARR